MQSTTAGSKEARQLEKVKKAFEDAYRNTKAKTNTAQDGGVRYSLYSRPNFTKDEWSIVNRRKHSEFDNPKYDLDENRKWMYAKEKGSTVFAVYSKSDPDDPTVLYGSSGKSAERDYAIVGQFIDGGRNNVKRGRKALDRLLASIQSDEGNGSNDSTYAEGAQTATGDVQFPVKESGSHGGRDSIDGTENLGQETVIEHDEEASDDSGASSITWSNDYAAIRNFMKDGDTGDKYSLSTSDDLAPTHGDLHISGKDVTIDFGPVREDLVTSQTSSALEGVPIGGEVEQDVLDSEQGAEYNNNRGDTYARTDEFRRLQEESQRMSDEEVQEYHSGRELDPEVRGRLSRAFKLELRSGGSKRNYSIRSLLNPKTNKTVGLIENVDGSLFHDVLKWHRNTWKMANS